MAFAVHGEHVSMAEIMSIGRGGGNGFSWLLVVPNCRVQNTMNVE